MPGAFAMIGFVSTKFTRVPEGRLIGNGACRVDHSSLRGCECFLFLDFQSDS